MKRQIKEILFKVFRRQILRATYNLNTNNFVQIREARFDWVKVQAQVSRLTEESLKYMKNPHAESERIKRELSDGIAKEISNIMEIEMWNDNHSYPPREFFRAELYVARKAK